MKIALAQLNYLIADFEGNRQKIITSIHKAKEQGAELVVFSELSVTGYYPHDLLEKKEFILKAIDTVREIAAQCTGISALVGAPAINDGERGKKLFNAAYFLRDGEICDIFCKTLLPTYDIFDEYRHFEPNRHFHLLETDTHRIAVTICEDLWDELPVHSEFGKDKLCQASPLGELMIMNPSMIINLSASPFSSDQENWRKEVLAAKAKMTGLPLIYVNQVGADAEMIYDGGSLFFSPSGEIISELAYFTEDFRVVDTGEIYIQEVQPPLSKTEKMRKALVLGIRDYFRKSGFSGAVLGLSGGIDSALVAVLAVEALGAANVRGLLMPSAYSSQHSIDDAVLLAQNLGIAYHSVPIQDTVESFSGALAPLFGNLPADVTEENIQARTRGLLLMAFSNKFGHIVLNTSNKSESAVGYGTLYGDMVGGLAVLGDVYKTEVYQLADLVNREKEIIPRNTILKAPSAELRPGQKDSDSLPEYNLLDKILFHYIELNKSPEEIASLGIDPAQVRKVIAMVNRNEYKRAQTAPILRITSKSFGSGRRMPLVGRY